MGKYSVLMSLYYKEKPEYLRQSLDSMINQTVKPDEIVMVYDGPLTDDLYTVMNEYIKQYPKLFNIVINEINLGLGLSLNKGLLACKNELVARMDTDDISKLDRCEKQLVEFSNNPKIDLLGGHIAEFITDMNEIIAKRIVPTNDYEIYEYIKKRCPFNHMTVMFKKEAVLKAGNYQDFFWNEDYFLWIRMQENRCVFSNLNSVLVYVRVGEEMYKRRGGWKYFKSELQLQNYMLKKKLIKIKRWVLNISQRFILQILMPNKLRGFIFKKIARE